ncbi:hypothetical protein B5X24_HaOG203230 [Helicoverpa armigera]|uniref:Uncharacterized protein n=1 Tax=Helicoverpa armigera TaxID=29058 RepID=A0A2W1BWD2_HELAM|nr:hypothetical protein B5X24_HaOG203230 [Helicoverpa armigera]
MQIRYLVDTLRNLYQIYKNEGGKYSYTTFFRYKPFYILSPGLASRDTCMCIKHSNMDFIFMALKLKGVITFTNIGDLLKNVACDTKSFRCMYNKCNECKSSVQYSGNNLEDEILWYQWVRVDHKYIKSGQEHVTKKTVKQQMNGTVSELILEFEKQLKNFKIHVFNWCEQYRQYRACVTNLTNTEMIILCDFSENFDCKYSKEIQSMHYGASKNSITLHTGVIFGKECSTSFATISDDNSHEPHSIWAHLIPVIKEAKQINPEMKIIHFFSDGPSSQYRQKKNFFLLNYFTKKLGLTHTTWSFSEAGHGKSLADGVGGSVKRQLDKRILYGEDITNATDAHKILVRTMKSVKTFYVSANDVKNIKTLIPEGIRAVPGTLQLHQIISTNINQIEHRILSCFCNGMQGLCRCHDPQTHILMTNYKMQEPPRTGILETATNNMSDMVVLPYLEPSEPFPAGTNDALVTGHVIERSLVSLSPEPSESLDPNFTTEVFNSESIIEHMDISLIDSITADEQFEDVLYFPLHSDKITASQFEKQDTIEYLEPIKDIINDSENIPSNHLPEQVSVMFKTECSVNGQVQATVLPANRVKVLEPGDIYQTPKLTLPAKRAKILKPTSAYHSSVVKRVKTLQPLIKSEDQEPQKKTAYRGPSSSKTFLCRLCKTRQPFILQNMVKCMVCKNWLCFSCSGTTFFDYICPICLED